MGDRLAGIREYDLDRYYREREGEARVREAREREEEAKKERVALFFERELRRLIPQERFDEELAKRLIAEEIDFARELLPDPEAPVIEDPRAKVERLLDRGISDREERLSEIEHKLAKIERTREKAEETLNRWRPEGRLFKETVREFKSRFPEGFRWHHLSDELEVEVDFKVLCRLIEESVREKVKEGIERCGGEAKLLKALEEERKGELEEEDRYVGELKESALYRPLVEELRRCKAETGFFDRLAGRYKGLDFDSLIRWMWGVEPFKKIYRDHHEHELSSALPFKVEVRELKQVCDQAFLDYSPLEREGAVNPRSYDHWNPLVLFEKHWLEGKDRGEIAREFYTYREAIDKAFARWKIPRNPTIGARRRLQYIKENGDRLDRLKAEKQSVLRGIKGLEEMREAVEETEKVKGASLETPEPREIEAIAEEESEGGTEKVKETKEFSGDPLDYLYLQYLAHGLHIEAASGKPVLVNMQASRKGGHELFKGAFGDYAEIKTEPVHLPDRQQHGLKYEAVLDPSFGFMVRRPTSLKESLTDKEFEAILSGLVDGRGFLRADTSYGHYKQRVEIRLHLRSLLDEVTQSLSLREGIDAQVLPTGGGQYGLICTGEDAYRIALLLTGLKHGEKRKWRDFIVKTHHLSDKERLQALKELSEEIGAENEEYVQEAREKMFKREMKQLEAPPSVEREKAKEERETAKREKTSPTRELLYQDYVVRGLSIPEIARKIKWHPVALDHYMRKAGIPIRSRGEARRLWVQRQVDHVRQYIRPDVRELLKKLEKNPDVLRGKGGRIKVRSLPPEEREKLRKEALRLKEIGKGRWGHRLIAKALVLPRVSLLVWYHPERIRDTVYRYRNKHKDHLRECSRKRRMEAKKGHIDMRGGHCELCEKPVGLYNHVFHEWDKDPKDKGKGFWVGKWGRKFIRDYGTPREEETFRKIRKKTMLLCKECHDTKVTALERKLGRYLSREEILRLV